MQKSTPTKLLPHNIPVYDQMVQLLRDKGKAIVVAAQGTGKSFITQEYLDKNKLNALVICPTLSICDQWAKLSSRVSTMTYQKFCRAPIADTFDCYVFDEAHHCGASVWGAATKELMDRTTKPVIGLTADSVRYLDGCRDVAFDLWDGCVVYGQDAQEAIQSGILPPTTYVCSLFDAGEKVKEFRGLPVSDTLMAQLEYSVQNCSTAVNILHRHMPTDTPRKGVVFVDSIGTIKDGVKLIHDAYPEATVFVIHSKRHEKQNRKALDEFIQADSGYIVAVDMLNEGVHVNGVNTLIMLRKTASPNLFMQQLGRGFAAGADSVVVFDFVGNNCGLKMIQERVSGVQEDTVNFMGNAFLRSGQIIVFDYASDILCVLAEIQRILNGGWTTEEDEILKRYYPTEQGHVSDRLSNRSKSACVHRAQRLGLHSEICTNWTKEEDEILIKYYPSEKANSFKRLPNRTYSACSCRAFNLGLSGTRTLWSPDEDLILRNCYRLNTPIEDFSKLINRTKSACLSRARKLGLPKSKKKWTSEEDAIIHKYYPSETSGVVHRLPGRTKRACNARAVKLGLRAEVTKNWTEEEDNIIREYYPTEKNNVVSRLANRTVYACVSRASFLGVTAFKVVHWSSEEDALLSELYKSGTSKADISNLLQRPWHSCLHRAKRIGLITTTLKRWSPEEDDIIRKYYNVEKSSIALRLPNRTWPACQSRARKLGVIKQKGT